MTYELILLKNTSWLCILNTLSHLFKISRITNETCCWCTVGYHTVVN